MKSQAKSAAAFSIPEQQVYRAEALPSEDKNNGWAACLPPRQPKLPLGLNDVADWLIVGAGFAGLGAARRLAELRPNDRIVILEASTVGDGASGRNSGFAIDLPHNVGTSLSELERASNYKRLLSSGIAGLRDLVRIHNIDCQWADRGKYHCAVTAQTADRMLPHHLKELESLGESYELLDRDALTSRLGTSYFHSGIYTPGGALLNPAGLVRGLADSLPMNAVLYENSPVLAMHFGNRIQAETPGGKVSAHRVMFTNGVFAQQFGVASGLLLPVIAYASLTAPLTSEQQGRLGESVSPWGVTPTNAVVGATLRFTEDRRILTRHQFMYRPNLRVKRGEIDRIKKENRAVFLRRFPSLTDVQTDYFWGGTITMTRNAAPSWGRVSENVYSAVGCNGVGVVKQSIAGSVLADLAVGTDNPLVADMLAIGVAAPMPRRPLLDFAARAMFLKERWAGRQDY